MLPFRSVSACVGQAGDEGESGSSEYHPLKNPGYSEPERESDGESDDEPSANEPESRGEGQIVSLTGLLMVLDALGNMEYGGGGWDDEPVTA